MGFYSAVHVHKQDPYGTCVNTVFIGKWCADSELGNAVTIEIAERCNGRPECVIVIKLAAKTACIIENLLVRFHLTVGLQKQDPEGAAIFAAVIIKRRANGDVIYAVAVKVANAGNGTTEGVITIKIAIEIAGLVRNFLVHINAAVLVHEQDPDGTAVVLKGRAHYEVADAISLQITDHRDGAAELTVNVRLPLKFPLVSEIFCSESTLMLMTTSSWLQVTMPEASRMSSRAFESSFV
ncbi:hypothetical protein N9235_00170 [Gammaproteobacteria bacterium]|nr:hypothetical protein [Gammaproteobacteria bacterium]